jgi:plasmid stabilization system protein ParE
MSSPNRPERRDRAELLEHGEKSVVGTRYVVAFALELSPSGRETVMILRIIHTAREWKPGEWPKS